MSRCAISIVVMLGAVTTLAAAARNCTETEERELARRHARCVDSVSERLISGNEPHHVKVCNGITEQVRKCALHFQDCMSSEELRLFKDVQIDTFVKLMDSEDLGHMLAQCEVVREFKGSGRALVKATDMCSVEQVQAAVDRREVCVTDEKERLHTSLVGVRTKQQLDDTICAFVDKSLHGCMEELHGCYDDKDFSEIKQTSLQLLDKVLDNLGAKFDLGTCDNVIGAAFLRSAAATTTTTSTWSAMAAALIALLATKIR